MLAATLPTWGLIVIIIVALLLGAVFWGKR
jgi:hypothetical protein